MEMKVAQNTMIFSVHALNDNKSRYDKRVDVSSKRKLRRSFFWCVFHLGLVFTLSAEKQKKVVIHPAQSQVAETQLGGGW